MLDLDDIDSGRRRTLLLVLLALNILCAAIFGTLTLFQGLWFPAMGNAAVLMVSLGLWVIVRRHGHSLPIGLTFLVLLGGFLLTVMADPVTSPTAIVWTPVLVVFCYALLGPRPGLLLGSGFVLAGVVVTYRKMLALPELASPMWLADALLPSLAMLGVCHFWTMSRKISDHELVEQLLHDPLTGLANRTKLEIIFQREEQRAKRMGIPLSLILIDLDHFKKINDRFGHEAGMPPCVSSRY